MARPPVPVFNASSNPRPPVPKFSAPTRVDDDEVCSHKSAYFCEREQELSVSAFAGPANAPVLCCCNSVSHAGYTLDVQDEDPSLTIVGYSSSLFRDDETAAWLEDEKHLQLWQDNKEEDLWIDRYDVRQLLTDASVFR